MPNLEQLTLRNEDASIVLHPLSRQLFSKLKLLKVFSFDNEEATFPYWFLQNIQALETLFVGYSSFNEIFQDEKQECGKGNVESSTQLKALSLGYLPQLQHICKEGFKIDPILEVVETLCVCNCSSLKSFLPSTAIFCYLKYLEIEGCHGLINLFTTSVVRSLVKLATMKIKECNSLEVIIEKEDEAKEEILFGALEILELVCLPKLNRFCSSKCLLRFKLLEKVVVKQCPRMNTFSNGSTSAVKLRKVQIEESDGKHYWEEDLNQIIRKMYSEKVAFQSFQHLRLAEYPELKELWFVELPHKIFLRLKSLVVQRCDFLTDSLFPLNLVQVLRHLEELEVRDCYLLQAVFDMEVKDDKEMQEKEISQLKKLTLSSLPRLKHVWKKDPKATLSFQNLCEVCVDECESLERLFPLSTVEELVKLEKLEVQSCGIDVIVAKEEGVEETIEFVFPVLSSIKFWYLKNLRSLYPGKHTSEWPSLKDVNIYDCKKLGIFAPALPIFQETKEEDVLDVQYQQPLFFIEKVIPNLECLALNYKDAMMIREGQYQEKLHNVKTLALQCFYEQSPTLIGSFFQRFANLEKLELSDSSYEMIFPWEGVSSRNTGMNIQIRQLRLELLRQLKYIWSKDSSLVDSLSGNLESLEVLNCSSLKYLVPSSICLENLTSMYVDDCEGLIYLITSSTAKSLVQLKTMTIVNCKALEHVICTDEEDEAEEEITFKSLESLELTSLSHLENFSSGEHTLLFPSLDVLKISGCPKMDMFSPGVLMAPVLNAVTMEEGKKHWKDGLNSTIRQLFQEKSPTLIGGFLQGFANLEKLELIDSSYEMIFPWEGISDRNRGMNIQIRQLRLKLLGQLKYIWSKDCSLVDSLSGNLESLKVLNCSSLKYLVPSSICLENLTSMYVYSCQGLIYLITSSSAKSLVQLKTMKIVDCRALEHVICADEEEEVEAEISFESLESLVLTSLSRLENFSTGEHALTFPSLDVLKISGCPNMNMFSPGVLMTPMLKAVTVEEGKKRWSDGLNSTIAQLFQEKVAFHGFKILELSEYPELKELWYNGQYSHGGHHIFANLKSLGVKKCDFLSDVLFSSNLLQVLCNLEELEVRDCASLEALIDVKGANGKEMQMKKISQLKKLKLSGLPNLKHILNNETHGIISFKNLLTVDVVDCENLESVFPVSLSKDLVQLQEVHIKSSGLVEIFSTEDGLEECRFDFPQLTKLRLWDLTKLKCFYPGRHILDCPSLKNLNIYHCGTLQTFSFDHSVFQQANGMGEDEFPRALFPLEKVCTKLELMALNRNDMKRITDDNYAESLFDKIVDLRIQCFHETQDHFPIDFLQRFPNLVKLHVRCCSFNALFPLKGVGHHHIGAPLQIRELILYKMEQLKYIWEEDILSSGQAETLDSLPSSISVKNLTILQIEDCKELVYLLTKSVAKSLLQLKSIYIKNCESMVDVVKNDEKAAEEIITFKNLECLILTSLSSLKSFCFGKQTFIFPSLVEIGVIGCPEMNIFSSGVVTAPLLQSVTVEEGRKHWKGDLNTTIQQLFNGKVIRGS